MVARVFRVISASTLLAIAACSGGGMTPVQTSRSPQSALPMPQSVSPASIKAAPMAHTAILPASAMITRRTAAAIVPQFWHQIPGTASDVEAAADGSIYILSDQPAGPDKYIWHYSGGVWNNVTGLAQKIAVAPDGTLYAVNSGGGIYSYSGGSWTALGGGASDVATVRDNSIYVITQTGTGPDYGIFHYAGGTWTQVPGQGTTLVGSLDTSSYTIPSGTLAPGGVYVLNSFGSIYYLNADHSYAYVPSQATAIASAPGGLLALGYPTSAANHLYFYQYDAATPGWSAETGTGVNISSNAGNLFVVANTNAIYETSLTTTPSSLVATPSTVDLAGIGTTYQRTYTVTEAGYNGAISESGTCAGIAEFSDSGSTGPEIDVTVKGDAVGTCSQTYRDIYGQTATVAISVTTGSVIITKAR